MPQIRTEFRKLATIRSPWLLLAAGPVIVVAGITGLVLSGANGGQNPAGGASIELGSTLPTTVPAGVTVLPATLSLSSKA